jgi:hypothetical protein
MGTCEHGCREKKCKECDTHGPLPARAPEEPVHGLRPSGWRLSGSSDHNPAAAGGSTQAAGVPGAVSTWVAPPGLAAVRGPGCSGCRSRVAPADMRRGLGLQKLGRNNASKALGVGARSRA